MDKKFSFIITYCLVVLLGVLGIAVLLCGDRDGGVSEKENRVLQGLPPLTVVSAADGSLSLEMEGYLSDQMFGRTKLLDLSSAVMDVFSVVSAEEALMQADMDVLTDQVRGDTPEASATDAPLGTVQEPADATYGETQQEVSSEDGAEAETELLQDTPVEMIEKNVRTFSYRNKKNGYTRIMAFSNQSIRNVAKTLNAYRAALPEDGNVYFTYVPYSQAANAWLLYPDRYSGWASDVEPALQTQVDDGVHIISTVNVLEPHMAAGERVFFLTDHHWSPLGAFYVQKQMIEETGLPAAEYKDYSYIINDRFLGSIYGQVRSPSLKKLYDTMEMIEPLAPTRAYVYRQLDQLVQEVPFMVYGNDTYSAILGGTHTPWYVADTGFHTGRNALIVADSAGNAFLPYLTPYYDTVCMCDLRGTDFRISAGASVRRYMAEYAIDDVYFVVTTGIGINTNLMQILARKYLG